MSEFRHPPRVCNFIHSSSVFPLCCAAQSCSVQNSATPFTTVIIRRLFALEKASPCDTSLGEGESPARFMQMQPHGNNNMSAKEVEKTPQNASMVASRLTFGVTCQLGHRVALCHFRKILNKHDSVRAVRVQDVAENVPSRLDAARQQKRKPIPESRAYATQVPGAVKREIGAVRKKTTHGDMTSAVFQKGSPTVAGRQRRCSNFLGAGDSSRIPSKPNKRHNSVLRNACGIKMLPVGGQGRGGEGGVVFGEIKNLHGLEKKVQFFFPQEKKVRLFQK